MAGQEDTLRLAAEVVDKWTGPMRKMRDALVRFAADVDQSHARGTKSARKHEEAFTSLGKTVGTVEEKIKSSLTPTLAAFGVTTLTVAGAIATLKDTVFGFADTTRQLTYLGRETGFTVQRLRELDALAGRLNIAPNGMRNGVAQFAQHMHDIRRMIPSELNAWRFGADKSINGLVRSIAKMPIDQALSQALGELDKIPNQQDKRKYLRLLGLPENMADVPVGQLRDMMREIHKEIGQQTPEDTKNAQAFAAAMDQLGDSLNRLKKDVGANLAPAFTEMTDAIKGFVDENRSGLVSSLKDVTIWIEKSDWKGFAANISSTAGAVGHLAKNFGDLASIINTIGDGLLGRLLLGVPGMLGGLAWNHSPWSALNNTPGEAWQKLQKQFDKYPPAFSPMAYHPALTGGARLFDASYTPGGSRSSDGSPEQVIARGTKIGVFDALREFFAAYSQNGGGAGGFSSISYPSGGAAGAARSIGNGLRGMSSRGDSGGGSLGPGTAITGNKGSVAAGVAAAWRAAGMSEAGIAGILGNVQQESNFNPNSRHPDQPRWGGEAHYAHGLYQEGGAEWNNYAGWLKKYHPGATWRNPNLQSTFAAENLKKNYPGVWARLKNATSPEDAARIYERGYEKPAPWAANEAGRMLNARKLFQRMHSDDLGLGKQGMLGTAPALNGKASLHIQFANMPRGTRVASSADGIFDQVSINRGRTMVPASQGS